MQTVLLDSMFLLLTRGDSVDNVQTKGNSPDSRQKRISKLEQRRVEDVQKLLTEFGDTRKMCRSLYEGSMQTGLYSAVRRKQGNLLASLTRFLDLQRGQMSACIRLIEDRTATRVRSRMMPEKELSQCVMEPTVAIRLCLAS